ncbi:pentapeptide repeat-containing protein [Spiractinospora alimapuensis]|uniref:pentapeptide repeat-containing protein n=1 Tax=Spiractinospora alimapuensis TaxID=2820884 RepID=UPI001F1F8839|nr:pentapeptide repeat-containing protein [Spiractinospora alimapuensis]QVQ51767.1 pentapeptide repeat-containing protein [Spiractinospora alimapuensis]
MHTPRGLLELPYAEFLEPWSGPPEREGEYDGVHMNDVTVDEVTADNARFVESALSAVTFAGGRLRHTRFNDVWMHAVRWSGTDMVRSVWVDAELVGNALSGVALFDSEMSRVTFFNCRFDVVNLRATTLRDVVFVDCLLREVDLAGAKFTRVSFPGSTLDKVHLSGATLTDVDLRGAESITLLDGAESLRGAVISPAQLVELALPFAHALGVKVAD